MFKTSGTMYILCEAELVLSSIIFQSSCMAPTDLLLHYVCNCLASCLTFILHLSLSLSLDTIKAVDINGTFPIKCLLVQGVFE